MFAKTWDLAPEKSPLNNIDARAKLIIALAIIVLLTSLPARNMLIIVDGLIVIGLIFSRIPLTRYLISLGKVLPFALMLILPLAFLIPGDTLGQSYIFWGVLKITDQGLQHSLLLALRFWGAVTSTIIVILTTSWEQLTEALRGLGIPDLIVEIMWFIGRYSTIFSQEMATMQRAQRNRGLIMGKNFWQLNSIRAIAQILGTLLIRSYERSERVYYAMLACGYSAGQDSNTG